MLIRYLSHLSNGGLILWGVVTMTSGLFDHLALARTFAAPSSDHADV